MFLTALVHSVSFVNERYYYIVIVSVFLIPVVIMHEGDL